MRIDSAALLVKDPNLGEELAESGPGEHPYQDRDQLHDIYRHWRSIADEYDEARVLVGEIWLPDAERFARYLRPDELHIAFNFDFLACPWEAGPMRTSIDSTLAVHAPVGAPATWVLSNHDVTRPVTRYGRADTSFAFQSKRAGTPTDLERGTRRGRAAALLAMALPGSMYIYQGEELGLPEVEDIPDERRQDPMWVRSGGRDPGRDGCRVPIPWTGDQAPVRVQPAGRRAGRGSTRPTTGRSSRSKHSPRTRPRCSRSTATACGSAAPTPGRATRRCAGFPRRTRCWRSARGESFTCIVNFGAEPVELPPGATALIASSELEGGALPEDTTVWLRDPVASQATDAPPTG